MDYILSFIIPNLSGIPYLKQTLDGILKQPHSEVIIVNWSYTEQFSDLVRGTFQTEYPNLKVIYVPNQKNCNISAARNIGARAASGKFLCFPHFDVVVNKGFIDECLPALDNESYIVCERSRPYDDFTSMIIVPKEIFFDIQGYDENLTGWRYGNSNLVHRISQNLLKSTIRNEFITHILEDYPKEDIVVLTAAFDVNNHQAQTHKITDRKERILQYIYGILSWSNTRIRDIVFCENSGSEYDLKHLVNNAEKHGTNIEVLKFKETKEAQKEAWNTTRGAYGLLEHRILKHVFDHSELLKQHSSFYKATGRIFIENFNSIWHLHKYDDNVFNQHSPRWIDSTFFKISCDKFKINLYDSDDDYKLFRMEEIFAKRINDFVRFIDKPIFLGRAGWSGEIYDKDYDLKIMEQVKEIAEKIERV